MLGYGTYTSLVILFIHLSIFTIQHLISTFLSSLSAIILSQRKTYIQTNFLTLTSRAGAQWRSHEKEYNEIASWDAETYRAWMELVEKEKAEGREGESGLAVSLELLFFLDMVQNCVVAFPRRRKNKRMKRATGITSQP